MVAKKRYCSKRSSKLAAKPQPVQKEEEVTPIKENKLPEYKVVSHPVVEEEPVIEEPVEKFTEETLFNWLLEN